MIVGFHGANLENERDLQPDVIIPRIWDRNADTLLEMAQRAAYESTFFPVKNLPTNGFPGLSGFFPIRHHFVTQLATGEPGAVVLERSPSPGTN